MKQIREETYARLKAADSLPATEKSFALFSIRNINGPNIDLHQLANTIRIRYIPSFSDLKLQKQ